MTFNCTVSIQSHSVCVDSICTDSFRKQIFIFWRRVSLLIGWFKGELRFWADLMPFICLSRFSLSDLTLCRYATVCALVIAAESTIPFASSHTRTYTHFKPMCFYSCHVLASQWIRKYLHKAQWNWTKKIWKFANFKMWYLESSTNSNKCDTVISFKWTSQSEKCKNTHTTAHCSHHHQLLVCARKKMNMKNAAAAAAK